MSTSTSTSSVARAVITEPSLDRVLARAEALLSTGFTAGNRYPEIWIRDFATFLSTSCCLGQGQAVRKALLCFFDFQQPDDSILDGIAPKGKSVDAYRFYTSRTQPDYLGHKNTVESDQESSLVRAIKIYVYATGDTGILHEVVSGRTVIDRLVAALEWLRRERWDAGRGLAWNATTIDWGDIQPAIDWREGPNFKQLTPERLPVITELGPHSHPAIGIYTNALLALAHEDLATLLSKAGREAESAEWRVRHQGLTAAIRRHLWDAEHGKYRPHVYLDRGSPFPADFDEAAIFFHGGTATAMQAGLHDAAEARALFGRMQANVRDAGARTVGITLWPLYYVPQLRNDIFERPFYYQNGGDWPWFGARVPLGLLRCGCPAEAWVALEPILAMIEESGGFFEWHRPDGTPAGSASFRGAAGVVADAILALRAWARNQLSHAT